MNHDPQQTNPYAGSQMCRTQPPTSVSHRVPILAVVASPARTGWTRSHLMSWGWEEAAIHCWHMPWHCLVPIPPQIPLYSSPTAGVSQGNVWLAHRSGCGGTPKDTTITEGSGASPLPRSLLLQPLSVLTSFTAPAPQERLQHCASWSWGLLVPREKAKCMKFSQAFSSET